MELDKAQKIHDLMDELYQVENFLKDLDSDEVEVELWLRKPDASVKGVASSLRGGYNYRLPGIKECAEIFYGNLQDEILRDLREM